MATVADVIKLVKDNEVKFVDFRFTDTRGKEQHVSVPVSAFGESKFTDGHFFDGSSIAGWKVSTILLPPVAYSIRTHCVHNVQIGTNLVHKRLDGGNKPLVAQCFPQKKPWHVSC